MNLYGLTKEYEEAYDNFLASIDGETGEIDENAIAALDAADNNFCAKAIDYAGLIRALEGRQNEFEAEIARLTEIKGKIDKLIERLSKRLSEACLAAQKTKIEGVHASISFIRSERVVIDDEETVPDEYKKAKTVITTSAALIKKAIRSGIEVPGAHIEERMNLQIK